MKTGTLTILLVILASLSFGQFHPRNHEKDFVMENGDTINREDHLGQYDGLHIYSDNTQYSLADSAAYTMGFYDHGAPIGLWTDHLQDGSYSSGQYGIGSQHASDGEGGWTIKQVIGNRVKEWKYYSADSSIIKIETYERSQNGKSWTDKTFLTLDDGTKALVKSEYKSGHKTNSPFRKWVTTKYRTDGTRLSQDIETFFRDISFEYFPNDEVGKSVKTRKFLGIPSRTTITKIYWRKGKLKKKIKQKVWPAQFRFR